MLDENLNFNCHVNSIIRNVTHKMYMLRRVSQFLTEKASLLIYKAFILPIMEYGNILYLNSSSKNLNKLQRLQNQCLKISLNLDKNTNTNMVHKMSNLNYLSERRSLQLIKHMFIRTKNQKFIETANLDRAQTRSCTVPKLHIPKFRSSLAKKSLVYHGSITWNNLNQNIKKITFKKQFNSKIKAIFREKIKNY